MKEECLNNFKYYYDVVNPSGGQVGQRTILIDKRLREASCQQRKSTLQGTICKRGLW